MNQCASLTGRRVVLIGGAGFIGHNLALELKKQGAEVSVVDGLAVNNIISHHCETYTNTDRLLYLAMLDERLRLLREAEIPLYVEDARDYLRMSLLINGKIKPQVVVLLAAVAHASRSNKDPFHTFDHSLRTLENALDFSRGNVEHFIYFSSSMVYGTFGTESVTEDAVCNPLGIYGALKFGGEKLVIAYNQVFGLPYTIVRPSALYGERCVSRRVGQVFIENAIRGQNLVVRGDGDERLDFTYIGDLVHGVVQCIRHPAAINQVFNLTYGRGRSLNEMVEIIQEEFPGITVAHIARDALMPERGTLDVSKAGRLIDYRPRYPLEEGYRNYIRWYREFFGRVGFAPAELATAQVNE